jgi:molybdopterin-guanine dinucleotide biosynthesis protein B
MKNTHPPILLIVAGKSGSGKTTVLERLIPELKNRGLKIGTIKHHHGDFDMDIPGKDSWRHKMAGAEKTLVSSPNRIGIVMDADHDHSPEELAHFFSGLDVILAEGYKGENLTKVEIFRKEAHEKPLCLRDKNLIAMVTDSDIDPDVPRFDLDDIKGLADLIVKHFSLESRNTWQE